MSAKMMLGIAFTFGSFCAVAAFQNQGYYKEKRMLTELISFFSKMTGLLAFRNLSLSTLWEEASDGEIKPFFRRCSWHLQHGNCTQPQDVVLNALEEFSNIPPKTKELLLQMGYCAGIYDFDNQILKLNELHLHSQEVLQSHLREGSVRLRTQNALLLGIGAIITILLL